jgi:thiosulfate/3-mercaptopyruvate sulfurtransferase
LPVIEKSIYKVFEKQELVKNKKQIDKNIINKEFLVVDARSRSRFKGEEPEPRKGLRNGSIPNSLCLPFKECINEDHTFKKKKELLTKFKSILGDELIENVIFSCGSGVTASVLALAYSLINNKYVPTIYDGSWSEYGKL